MEDARADSRLLILGAASVTGRSFARGLRLSKKYSNALLIGGDIFSNVYTIAEGLFDKLIRMPRCDDSSHESILSDILERNEIDACVVLAELEVIALANSDIEVPAMLPYAGFCNMAASKAQVFSALTPLGLAPEHENQITLENHETRLAGRNLRFPLWVRSGAAGTTSGMGSFLAKTPFDLKNWLTSTDVKEAQAAAHLPGRNWACLMTYFDGNLTAFGIYERLTYLMASAAPSGVTGNIAVGQIQWNREVLKTSLRAVKAIEDLAGTPTQGFLTVDLKETSDGTPMVTEINLKPVACVGAFCHPKLNLAEHFVDLILGARPTQTVEDCIELYLQCYSEPTYILRDVDGDWVLVDSISLPEVGKEVCPPSQPSWWRSPVTES